MKGLLAALVVTCAIVAASADVNIVRNPGFQDGGSSPVSTSAAGTGADTTATSWRQYQNTAGTLTTSIVTGSGALEGDRSMRVQGPQSAGLVSNNYGTFAAGTYTLKAWVYITAGSAGAALCHIPDGGSYVCSFPVTITSTANQWFLLTDTFTLEVATTLLQVGIHGQSANNDYIVDSVSLVAVNNIIPNPGFELGGSSVVTTSAAHTGSEITATGWRQYQNVAGTLTSSIVTGSDALNGNRAVRIQGPQNSGLVRNNYGAWLPGSYAVSVWVFVKSGSVGLALCHQAEGQAYQCAFSTTTTGTRNQWVKLSETYTFDSPMTLLQINVYGQSSSNDYHVDTVMMTPVANWVENPSFEEGGTDEVTVSVISTGAPTTATGWRQYTNSAGTLTTSINNGAVTDGARCIHVKGPASAGPYQNLVELRAPGQVTFSAWVFVVTGRVQLMLCRSTIAGVYGCDNWAGSSASNGEWKFLSHTFTLTDHTSYLQAVIYGQTSSNEYFIDSVTVVGGTEHPAATNPPAWQALVGGYTNMDFELGSSTPVHTTSAGSGGVSAATGWVQWANNANTIGVRTTVVSSPTYHGDHSGKMEADVNCGYNQWKDVGPAIFTVSGWIYITQGSVSLWQCYRDTEWKQICHRQPAVSTLNQWVFSSFTATHLNGNGNGIVIYANTAATVAYVDYFWYNRGTSSSNPARPGAPATPPPAPPTPAPAPGCVGACLINTCPDGTTKQVVITGAVSNLVWGSGKFTDDSDVGAAAVHSGHVNVGETKTLDVYCTGAQSSFSGSEANGVTSQGFGAWPASFAFSLEQGATGVPPPPAPPVCYHEPCLHNKCATQGEEKSLIVVGTTIGDVWGNTIFTDDSSVGAAAVHQGILAVGESGTVQATCRGPQDTYTGSLKNGITSKSYGHWGYSYSLAAGAPTPTTPGGNSVCLGHCLLGCPAGLDVVIRVRGTTYGYLWGSAKYTDDTTVAAAAVHSGLVASGEVKEVLASCQGPQTSFTGSTANGVTTQDYGSWGGSFVLAEAPTPQYTVCTGTCLNNLCTIEGRVFHITVTGTTSGNVWGTSIYSQDSEVGKAAVHAGLVTAGNSANIKAVCKAAQNTFEGSTNHGVTTSPYSGSFFGTFTLEA